MPQTKQGRYEITETGLVVRDGWTAELWEAAGHEIARYQKGLMWLIGDWLNAGDREGYVERGRLARGVRAVWDAYKTSRQAAWVARCFESSVVANICVGTTTRSPNPQAGELLEWAAERGGDGQAASRAW
jgi:hypothetical protein